ncbi:ATP-binding protein [Microbacterium sorbitolivorans]|uniref:ATP/GTP-binding protein n=1 Tax=Microbacterium sorbitolivorans TaxID=1867410 RepID=A0A367XTH1_9MICO|nr:ATP/GTP-binding protein [Microbacterium sorbitolivorans]RCK56923.1 ATP/GTP-binding protein [Microbacterium sorbitolivorans]GGF49842.1 ATP-binding protein [Microbacterium sorbitolivorans]
MQRGKTLDQQIAVFGESGSGKTVLLSSFYGATQEASFRGRALFDVVADDIGQGTRLHRNYLGMRDSAMAPTPTHFAATSYAFSLKLKHHRKNERFDAVRLTWHDYPGEWFEQSVSGPEEAHRRVETFRALLGSDVAFLLVDAQKLLDHAGEEERYLKSLLGNFRNGILSMREGLLRGKGPLIQFPRIWVMALSKADLMPEADVYAFRDLMIAKVADEIDALRETIAGLIQGGSALSVGEDFMLLSSAKFDPQRIDVSERVGVELILPIAAMLPFERHVRWAQRKEAPGKVLEQLNSGVNLIAGALLGRLISRTGPVGLVMKLLSADLVDEASRLAGDALRKANEEAKSKHENVRAILTSFRLELDEAEEKAVLIRSRR